MTLKDLKVGDKVFYETRYNIGIVKIKRITKKLIVLEDGSRYKKDTGWLYGGSIWDTDRIQILTPEHEKRIYIKKLQIKATQLRDKLSIPHDIETLEKLIVAIKPFIKEETT